MIIVGCWHPKCTNLCKSKRKSGYRRASKMRIRKSIILLLLVVALAIVVFVAASPAALPPGSYDKLKAEAQEKLTIKIIGVEKLEQSDRRIEVLFTAEVLSVERSETCLKPGDTIQIQSYRWTKRYAGPKNPPLLPVGWIGIAYLNKADIDAEDADNLYTLASYGASFEESQ
jgi:hypothetical protein